MTTAYTASDLESHNGLGLVIRDASDRYLCFLHNKFDFWTIPLGKVGKGQTVEQAVRAEALQECGILPTTICYLCKEKRVYDREGHHVIVLIHLYEVLDYDGTLVNAEPTKHSAMRFLTLQEIKDLKSTSDATSMLLRWIRGEGPV